MHFILKFSSVNNFAYIYGKSPNFNEMVPFVTYGWFSAF